ncbi:MAG: hypothetical protein LUI87_16160 [Lachnospiraceae bacterium]|nr:hypothetical protein [Lachnospiraceae bacterium]
MYYQDDFSRTFLSEAKLHQHLFEVSARATWERMPSCEMEVLAATGEERDIADVEKEDLSSLLFDTMKHTCLILRAGGKSYLLGSTAIPTLQRRARISGSALSAVATPVLADILNECLAVAEGKSLLRFSEGKIRAVHSGDKKDYSIIEMTDIFMAASAYISEGFENTRFSGGYTDHAMTYGAWTVSDKKMLDAYRELSARYGRTIQGDLYTDIRVTSSDVAVSGANISYNIKEDGHTVVLGRALKTIHRGSKGIEEVEDNLKNVFEYYKATLKGIERLFHIRLRYPENAMAGVMRSVKLGKKLIAETVENFRAENDGQPCTAYDAYCGICQALVFARKNGAKERAMLDLEEDIARCILSRWTDYDIPGEVKY